MHIRLLAGCPKMPVTEWEAEQASWEASCMRYQKYLYCKRKYILNYHNRRAWSSTAWSGRRPSRCSGSSPGTAGRSRWGSTRDRENIGRHT